MEKLLLKPGEVVQMIGISKSKVYLMMETGELPCVRIGRCVRVSTRALEKWIQDRQGPDIPIDAASSGGPNGGGGRLAAMPLTRDRGGVK